MDASTLAAVAIATETSQPAAVEEQEIPNIPEAPPIVIDYTEMPVLVPDEVEVPQEYAGAAQDGLLGNAPAHVADDAS